MGNTNGHGTRSNRAAFSASLRSVALVLSVVGATSCSSPSSSSKEVTPGVSSFWSNADESIHDAQSSLRSARRVARQLGGEAAKGDYEQVIALGHRLGGLGHDHVTPAENEPVISILESMIGSIDALTLQASTSAELDEAKRATEADVSKLSLPTQRLYHLLTAKKKVVAVRDRAKAMGFRPTP